MAEEQDLDKAYRDAQSITDKATKIAQVESTRNESFDDVSFDPYIPIGIGLERRFRKYEGGRVVGDYSQAEMEAGIASKMEDPFIAQGVGQSFAEEDAFSQESAQIKSKINAAQVTVSQSPTDLLGADGYRTEQFIVVINGVPLSRNFVIR